VNDEAPMFREGQRLELGRHSSQIRWLRLWVVLLTVLAALGPIAGAAGYWRAANTTRENCVRIHRIVGIGQEIIGDPDAEGRPGKTLRQYRDAGTLTAEQYASAIGHLKHQLARWESADCPPPSPLP
jgi:hypothetical protein